MAAKCLDGNYVGCHVYKITAGSTQNINNANITLDSLTLTATTKTDWHYALFAGTDSSATEVKKTGNIDVTTPVDMHNAALTGGEDVTYYLIIYITNQDAAQNTTDNGGTNQTGSYTGTVSMKAAGGQVSATFSAATP